MEDLISVSYDQYKNIPSCNDINKNIKIVFSGECYFNIMKMSMSAIKKNIEHGRFFVGRRISTDPEVIYFDYNTSEFEPARGPMGEGKAVEPTQRNYDELNNKLYEYRFNGIKPVVMHFHSHPRTGIYENFSDQDLHSYATGQVRNSNITYLGMLGFPINNTSPTFGMCIVYPFNAKINNGIGTANFIRCENIYFTADNEIYKVGSFEKKYNGRTYNKNINTKIVNTYLTLPYNARVCAEGIDPNTNERIEPKCVGYKDTDEHLYFTDENLRFKISNTSKTI